MVISVRWDFFSVRFQSNQVSTVPNNKLPSFSVLFAKLLLLIIHFIFVAEKYGSTIKPVILVDDKSILEKSIMDLPNSKSKFIIS